MIALKSLVRDALTGLGREGELLLFIRFLRKLPALWTEERCVARHRDMEWADNRIVVAGDGDFFPIYSPDDLGSHGGGYLRTYNIFCHQANAWYMRREVSNFIQYAKKYHRFADVGSAEGFYSALFASIHGRKAEILAIDCGSTTGCNPAHTPVVRDQNQAIFAAMRWDLVIAFVTDSAKKCPDFPLPLHCKIATLPEIFRQADFVPDLIKFDIESSEHEVLLDSLDYLQKHRPALIVEVHNEILERRGLSFKPVLEALQGIGYVVVAYDDPDYLKSDNCHVVIEMSEGG